ncbi:MAG TPA: DUF1080 domain-containing protein [Polyangiaceae bacterium]|nr:DUF1080 domain-containing protein [Polyangiaceae bacterium]
MPTRRLRSREAPAKFLLHLILSAAPVSVLSCSDSGDPATGIGGSPAVGGSAGGLSAGVPSSTMGGSPASSAGAGAGVGGSMPSGQGGSNAPVAGGGGAGTGGAPSAGGTADGGAAPNGGAPASSGAGGKGGSPAVGGAASAGGGAGGASAGGGGTTTAGNGGGGASGGGPPIVDLFNGVDLTGFTAYRETSATAPGTALTPAQAQQIFKVEAGAIRVYGDFAQASTQARHTLVTAASYSKYKLWLEYKWGTKTFAPYADTARYPRDAGILFHLHRAPTQVWPPSIEFQIKDGSTGDIFALYARCTSLARNGGTTFVDLADGGTEKLVNGSTGFVQHIRSANREVPEWNSLLLEVNGGTAVFNVNGQVVNRVLSVMDRDGNPIISGPIAFQAEHAETFYRNIRIQVLP